MRLLSVNLGTAEPMPAAASGVSGICKHPCPDPVDIGHLGLAGDKICDADNHGGEDQAVYVYPQDDYDWWSYRLGRELEPGTFGENLTIGGFESADVNIGDRLEVGDVVLEVTAPRIPCATLSARMEDPEFAKAFRAAGRPGFYCRVIRPGPVRMGDEVRLRPYRGDCISIGEMFRDHYNGGLPADKLRRYLEVPVHRKVQDKYQKRLRGLARR